MNLGAVDVIKFLKDSGVELSPSQLKSWLGSVDDEKDGYDKTEFLEVVEFFDDMDGWNSKGRTDASSKLASISDTNLFGGMSAFGDLVFMIIAGGFLGWFLMNSEAMDKKLAANSFVS